MVEVTMGPVDFEADLLRTLESADTSASILPKRQINKGRDMLHWWKQKADPISITGG
ncbi:hypothetical protein TSMEX_006601 [Taenia solium]|eukprot:TsM_000395600 transcript=TsM_000395600 gene=TsM_000395600